MGCTTQEIGSYGSTCPALTHEHYGKRGGGGGGGGAAPEGIGMGLVLYNSRTHMGGQGFYPLESPLRASDTSSMVLVWINGASFV